MFVQQIRIISCYSNNMGNIIKTWGWSVLEISTGHQTKSNFKGWLRSKLTTVLFFFSRFLHFCKLWMCCEISKTFAVRSLRSWCLIDTKPPFLHLMQCYTLHLLPQGHVVGKSAILYPYRKRIASQKCC